MKSIKLTSAQLDHALGLPRTCNGELYRVVATVVIVTDDGYRKMAQIPTFFLDRDVQGIECSEHAARIAASTVDPFRALGRVTISVCRDSDDGDYYTNTYGEI